MQITNADLTRATLLVRRWGPRDVERLVAYAIASERARVAVWLNRTADAARTSAQPLLVVLALRDAADLLRASSRRPPALERAAR